MDAGKTFEGLPGWAKGAIAVGTLGLSAMVGFTIYNKLKRSAALGKEKQSGKEVDKQIEALKLAGGKGPTLTGAQLSIMADQLKTAFSGAGTDTDKVYAVMAQLKNDADALSLIKTYGIRSYENAVYGQFKGTLSEAIASEVPQSSLYRKSINDINEMFGKKGIKTTF